MKKLIFLIFLLPSVDLLAQQVQQLIGLNSTSNTTKKLRSDSNAEVYLLATGGTAITASNISAAGGAGFSFHKNKLFGILSANWGGVVSKKQNVDSIPLSSLVFPDIQNTSGLLKLGYCVKQTTDLQISIVGNFAYQLINATKDSITYDSINKHSSTSSQKYSFNIINAGIGLNFIIPFSTGSSNKLGFSATVQYCGTWILPNTNESFGQYYFDQKTKTSLPKNIGGVYGIVSFHLNDSQVYLRCYYVPTANITSNIADRTIFSVGITTLVKTLL